MIGVVKSLDDEENRELIGILNFHLIQRRIGNAHASDTLERNNDI